jgi:hypothetical protein
MLTPRLRGQFSLSTLTTFVLLFSLFLTQNVFAALILVNPTQGPPGTEVTVTGSDWPAGNRIKLSWTSPPFNTMKNVEADENGVFTTNFTVPQNAPIGMADVNAINEAGDITWQAKFIVTAELSVSLESQPSPGWYSNGVNTTIYEDNIYGLRISWANSYIYKRPGNVNLYWYAEIVYKNIGSNTIPLTCDGLNDPSLAKEHISNNSGYLGYVPADQTFCKNNPNWNGSIKPGEAHRSWAIFHNVPSDAKISIEWGPYPFSQSWANPWYFSFNAPQPSDCPPELVTFNTCQPGGQTPDVPHPGAYEIAEAITNVWKRFNDFFPSAPPTSLTDGIIAAGCGAGTALVIVTKGYAQGYVFATMCITSFKDIVDKQCGTGDPYVCFINYIISHPGETLNIVKGILPGDTPP